MSDNTFESLERTERLLRMAAEVSALASEERDQRLIALATSDPDLVDDLRALPYPLSVELSGAGTNDIIPERLGFYRLLRQVGRGGMGLVFEAVDERWGRRVAIKLIRGMGLLNPSSRLRLEQEARSHASLDGHDGIVPLYDAGWDGDSFYLVMRFFEGETLEAKLEREIHLSPSESLAIARQLADALSYAHERMVVHRDIKPANVMVNAQGRVCLLDFGIADLRAESSLAYHGGGPIDPRMTAARGSLDYMSPEQLANLVADPRSDLWSLGCVLFECLTGKRAVVRRYDWLGEPRPAEVRWHLLPRRTPKGLRHLLERCLAEKAEGRFSTAAELGKALAEAQGARARLRRNRVILGFSVLIIVVLLGGPGWRAATRGHLERIEVLGGRTVHAVSSTGRTLWERDYPESVQVNHGRRGASVEQTVWVEGKRPRGAIVSVGGKDGPAALTLLDPASGRTLWRRVLRWNEPVNGKGQAYYAWTRVIRWNSDGPQVLLAAIADGEWYGSCVQVWSLNGSLLSEYDHPGGLTFVACEPVRPGAPCSVFLCGVNSSARFRTDLVPFETRNHCGALVRLEQGTANGQAFPYSEGMPMPRDWPGLPRSRETAYVVIPPLIRSEAANIDQALMADDAVYGRCIRAHLLDGRIYTFDLDLRPLLCYVGVNTPADRSLKEAPARAPLLRLEGGRPERLEVDLTY